MKQGGGSGGAVPGECPQALPMLVACGWVSILPAPQLPKEARLQIWLSPLLVGVV